MLLLAMPAQAQLVGSSTTSVSASAAFVPLGVEVTFTVQVTATAGDITEPGLGVTLFDGSSYLVESIPVTGTALSGTATYTTTFTTVGERTILAVFNGTSSVGSSGGNSGTMLFNVIPTTSTTTISVSPNPSEAGEEVTLTANITAAAGDVTDSNMGVSFWVDNEMIVESVPVTGSALSGTATYKTTFAETGTYEVLAVYAGGDTVGSSNNTTTHTVVTPSDSLDLRAMQIVASRQAALTSGQAFTGAIGAAVSGVSGPGQATLSANGLHLSYGPESGAAAVQWPTGGAPQSNWQVWTDLRGAGVGDGGDDDLSGLQLNALAGVTRIITPDFYVGFVGGYETFGYDSDSLDASLDGDGWTVGGYVGGKIAGSVRYFAAAGYSGIGYDGTAGEADGSFDANRWIVSGGVSGAVPVSTFTIEPSANIFGIWENQDSYTDSLGTFQEENDFDTGRFSTGAKIMYPVQTASGLKLVPYAGLYADYSFEGSEDVAGTGLTGDELSSMLAQGWSARAMGGVTADFAGGSQFSLGAEVGGLGDSLQIWTVRSGLQLPF
jgi:hypothetical protein